MKIALVIDDNEMNLELMRFLLESGGWAVHTCGDAPSALATLAQIEPTVILMDLGLPGISGFELTATIKAQPRDRAIPIIAVTAAAMKGDEARAREAGCDGYISKPIDTRRFLDQIAEMIAGTSRG